MSLSGYTTPFDIRQYREKKRTRAKLRKQARLRRRNHFDILDLTPYNAVNQIISRGKADITYR